MLLCFHLPTIIAETCEQVKQRGCRIADRATTKHTNTPVPLLIREKENYTIDVICP